MGFSLPDAAQRRIAQSKSARERDAPPDVACRPLGGEVSFEHL